MSIGGERGVKGGRKWLRYFLYRGLDWAGGCGEGGVSAMKGGVMMDRREEDGWMRNKGVGWR